MPDALSPPEIAMSIEYANYISGQGPLNSDVIMLNSQRVDNIYVSILL